MKYREDMMEELAKCPGMRPDHPGTTPNALPQWRSFSTCKRERERCGKFVAGMVGKKEVEEEIRIGLPLSH
jgi:hypothetical protein